MRRCFAAIVALLAMFSTLPVRADDNRPLTVTITAEATGNFDVVWKVPANMDGAFLPDLAPPGGCTAREQTRQWEDAMGSWRQRQWTCPQGLAGADIAITYPLANPGLATIARFHPAQGAVETILLQPGEHLLHIPVPQAGEEQGTFAEFAQLGFEHIWEGIDHLLFVTGLIIIAGTWRRILVTVTGFTIAHSFTLALAALDVIRLNPRAVEAVIALSIVFLAIEIARGNRQTLTWRRPVIVAAGFGLLHGFGFANVLREIGLPDEGLLAALFAFNVGIEIGQVIFAAGIFGAWQLAVRLLPTATQEPPLQRLAAYGLGITASVWLIERVTSA